METDVQVDTDTSIHLIRRYVSIFLKNNTMQMRYKIKENKAIFYENPF
jgi:hypothetical protein